MKDLEANKIAASILVAALLALIAGKISSFLYPIEVEIDDRGFVIETAKTTTDKATEQEEVEIDLAALLATADITSGQKTFKKCKACHTVDSGGADKVGPNLYGILGADIGGRAEFKYSKVLAEMEGDWNYENLFAFIAKPKKFAPGTKMSFIGLKKPQDVADIIAYLRDNGGTSIPLPQVVDTAPPAEGEETDLQVSE